MSAFLVDKTHIDALITAGLGRPSDPLAWGWDPHGGTNWHRNELRIDNTDDVGSMLWTENLRSVAYRYPEDVSGGRPGPIGVDDLDIMAYRFERLPHSEYILPGVVFKALGGYEYQSCEHPGWEHSEARGFCEALRQRWIRRLPEYEGAPWHITDRKVFLPQDPRLLRRYGYAS